MPISRTQTLLLKMAMTAGITVLTTTLVMIATVGILGMDASHLPLLWIYSYCASLAVGLGVQAINAAFGASASSSPCSCSSFWACPPPVPPSPRSRPGLLPFPEPLRTHAPTQRRRPRHPLLRRPRRRRPHPLLDHDRRRRRLALLFGLAMTRYYDRKGLDRLTTQPSRLVAQKT